MKITSYTYFKNVYNVKFEQLRGRYIHEIQNRLGIDFHFETNRGVGSGGGTCKGGRGFLELPSCTSPGVTLSPYQPPSNVTWASQTNQTNHSPPLDHLITPGAISKHLLPTGIHIVICVCNIEWYLRVGKGFYPPTCAD